MEREEGKTFTTHVDVQTSIELLLSCKYEWNKEDSRIDRINTQTDDSVVSWKACQRKDNAHGKIDYIREEKCFRPVSVQKYNKNSEYLSFIRLLVVGRGIVYRRVGNRDLFFPFYLLYPFNIRNIIWKRCRMRKWVENIFSVT